MNKLLITGLTLITSCSYVLKSLEDEKLISVASKSLSQVEKTYCPLEKSSKIQLVNTNVHSQEFFSTFLENHPELDFFDQFALWTLLQISIRPDQSSPSSRLQILFNQGESKYFDFYSEETENQFPLLYGVEWILKKYQKKTSLEHYARIIDQKFKNELKVGKSLQQYLLNHKQDLLNHPVLGPHFVKGSETLQEDERTPAVNFTKLIAHYRRHQKDQKISVNMTLSSFETQKGNKGQCNYDFNLYENSIFLIDKTIPEGNLFGYSHTSGSFLAASSQKIEKQVAIENFPLFKGQSKVRSTGVCILNTSKGDIWTLSNMSRDPGQHLFHLIKYGLLASENASDVDKLLRHSRHIFLNDPLRLIIESNRSKPDQIENLLKINIPIYNADQLGNVWAFTSFNNKKRFIIDDRNPGAITCK